MRRLASFCSYSGDKDNRSHEGQKPNRGKSAGVLLRCKGAPLLVCCWVAAISSALVRGGNFLKKMVKNIGMLRN
jgi:hypothetical protein